MPPLIVILRGVSPIPHELRALDLFPYSLSHLPLSAIAVRHQHGELLAAVARHGVHLPRIRLQDVGHRPEQDIPFLMAVGIVHLLELIEIEEDDAEIRVASAWPGTLSFFSSSMKCA